MTYRLHDGCVLRSAVPPLAVEMYAPEKKTWVPFPELSNDIRDSSITAWFHGAPLSEGDLPKFGIAEL